MSKGPVFACFDGTSDSTPQRITVEGFVIRDNGDGHIAFRVTSFERGTPGDVDMTRFGYGPDGGPVIAVADVER